MISVVVPTRHPEELVGKAGRAYPWAHEVVLQGGPGGAALARNNGARRAVGDVLVFTDDDVDLVPLSAWDPPAEQAFWTAQEFQAGVEDTELELNCMRLSLLSASSARMRWLTGIGPFTAVRRWAFNLVGGYRRALMEDVDFSQRLHQVGVPTSPAPFRVRVNRPFSELPELQRRLTESVNSVPMGRDGPAIVLRPASARL